MRSGRPLWLPIALFLPLLAIGCGRSSFLPSGLDCPPDNPNCGLGGNPGGGDGGTNSDGGTTNSDGGTTNSDGGMTNSDGGMTNSDGGATNSDGGATNSDGGATNSDGGTTNSDGGTTNSDGGATNSDGGATNSDSGTTNSDGGGTNSDGGNVNGDGGQPDLVLCVAKEICNNGIDDDCNGLVDCFNHACQSDPSCIDKKTEICNNGIDDNGNGLIDCKDPQCYGDPACIVLGREICNNGIDDNDNGLIDCADPQCFNDPVCKPQMGKEICDNGIDDNNDGLVDCADPQCVAFPACLHAACSPDFSFGAINPHDSKSIQMVDTLGAKTAYQTCASPGGTGLVGEFTLTGESDVRIDFSQVAGSAHVVDVFRAGVGQACDQNPVYCLQAGQMASATHTLQALAAGTYRVIVESYQGTQGQTTVTLSTASSKIKEICNNGVDDNGNGLIDCADLDCVNDPHCTDEECNPDINLGTLIVNGPGQVADFDTHNSTNRYHPTCAGTSTGNDEVVRFTLKQTAGVLVSWTQTGDHVFGLFTTPPPGLACDANQISCYYPGGAPGGNVAYQTKPPGDYIFIFKPTKAGLEGHMHMTISAYVGRLVEICNNGIDDDGNGLIDCADPACFGVGNCKAPLCTPDDDLGDIDWGTSKNVMLDLTKAPHLDTTKCGKGNGGDRVVRVNLLQPMALGFNCTETGDQILQLDAQLQPLDLCDANLLVCADPKILPFGCNFAIPNLQAGKYNVIVEAFQSGSEGTVDLTLSGYQEHVLEICDNGIDDDMDGFTDCADKKCVTSPLCAKYACRADHRIGLLPLDGSMTSAVVQTQGNGDNETMTPCVSAAGGQDAVVDFELPAKADLTIDWAQVGNHDFALYQDSSDLLACEANPLIDCHASLGAATGSYQLTNVPQGKVHLVVDADAAGKEGGVVLQLFGMPSK